MKKNKNNVLKTNMLLLAFCILPALLFLMPNNLEDLYANNWICDSVCLTICFFVLAIMYFNNIIDSLSPVVFVSVFYLLLFFVTPLHDMYIDDTEIFGITDLFNYGIKGSLMALGGFLSFCGVYSLFYVRYKKASTSINRKIDLNLTGQQRDKISQILLIMWCAYFVLAVVLQIITTGFSIKYMLSFGMMGGGEEYAGGATDLGFISQFVRGIISVYLMYFCVGKSRTLKMILFILTSMVELLSGFRYMIVVFLFAIYYFIHISKGKKLRLKSIIILALLLSFIVGFVGFNRSSVRHGTGATMEGFTKDEVSDAVIGNFRIYLSYYGTIKAVPAMMSYIGFDQMVFYTIILVIPRKFWPGKPRGVPGKSALLYGMNQVAYRGGFAFPCLGEYYISFGIPGVILIMGIMGALLAHLSNKYGHSAETIIDQVWYCIATAATFQLLIRGYTPTNFYFIITLFIPCRFTKMLITEQRRLL